GNAEWRSAADGVDGGGAPAAKHLAGDAVVQPATAGAERQLHDRRDGQTQRNVAGADRALRLEVVEVLTEHVEGPEAAPVRRGIVHQPAPGEGRQQRDAARE